MNSIYFLHHLPEKQRIFFLPLTPASDKSSKYFRIYYLSSILRGETRRSYLAYMLVLTIFAKAIRTNMKIDGIKI